MSTAWIHCYHLVVAAADVADVADLCAAIGPAGLAEREGFSLGLSPSGQPPATHFAASGQVTEPMRQVLETLADAGQIPAGVAWYRCDLEGRLVRANRATVAARIGQPFTFDDALADLGLRRVAALA